MSEIVLVLDNVRSAHNVGVILRTADGAGVQAVWLCGLTPSPNLAGDARPAYVQVRAAQQIAKTALGAEKSLKLCYTNDVYDALSELRSQGFVIAALEQSLNSIDLIQYKAPAKLALVVGHEVDGVNSKVLGQADAILEIPMRGTKESLNVAVATGIALYQLTN